MNKEYLKYIDPKLLEYKDEVKRIRRDLHRIPELGFNEYQTQKYLKEYLEELGYEPKEIVGTGLILPIPGNIEGSTIALRTDIDALPILEPEINDYRSIHSGRMHACGHDGHMTMLLLLAKILKKDKNIKHRNLLLIFQPAEESPGGAKPIIDTGILEEHKVGEIYGFHLIPFIEEGVISTTPGPMFAMTSEFYPVIKGKSSHAGEPENGVDAIVAASQFVLAVQNIISRNIKPADTALINIGTFEAGEAMNIVADEAKLSGTIRSYSVQVHDLLKKKLINALKGIDEIYGTKSELNFIDMYKPIINDEDLFNKLWEQVSGPKEIFDKVMLAEDFSMYQEKIPGVFIGLGTKNERYTSGLHTPEFNFNEDVLLRGVDEYLKIIETNV